MTRRIGLLGSTGSIGTQALEVIRHFSSDFDVVALTTHTDTKTLSRQVEEFNPGFVGVTGSDVSVSGDWIQDPECLRRFARLDLDLLVVAVAGPAGLRPTLDALQEGTDVALASKEAIVVGGPILRQTEKESFAELIPIDSEHHGVMQVLRGEDKESVRKVYLTASGGPFLDRDREKLKAVSPDEALQHPNWNMGEKITIDSATLMNKGLEIIEASYLFELDEDQIESLIHPQSKVHALVEFNDYSLKAQLSVPDMRQTLQSALYHPDRHRGLGKRLQLREEFSLDFRPVDPDRFPAYELALQALSEGGLAPTVLNAANTRAVKEFLRGELEFVEIPAVVEQCLRDHPFEGDVTLDRIRKADRWAQKTAQTVIEELT